MSEEGLPSTTPAKKSGGYNIQETVAVRNLGIENPSLFSETL